jgi:hypothetical protein
MEFPEFPEFEREFLEFLEFEREFLELMGISGIDWEFQEFPGIDQKGKNIYILNYLNYLYLHLLLEFTFII